MTEKQRRFAEAYAKDPNATAAAVAAGYSVRSAYSTGQRLLKNVEVQEYIHALSEPEHDARIASAEDVRRFWTQVMNDNTAKTTDRLKASELLGKSFGMFMVDINATLHETDGDDVLIYLPQID